MASEYTLNGVDLEDAKGRWFVMKGTHIPGVAAPRNASVEVPLRNGVLPASTASWGTFKVTVSLMVTDARDGALGGGRAALEDNWQALMTILHSPTLMTLGYKPAGMTERTTKVRVSGISDPSFHYGGLIYETAVIFESLSGIWKDTAVKTMDSNLLAPIDGGSRPITDAILLATAYTGTVLKVTDVVSGSWISWSGTVPENKNVRIDCAAVTARFVAPGGWDEPGDDASKGLDLSPRGFAIWPDPAGAYAVKRSGGYVGLRASRSF